MKATRHPRALAVSAGAVVLALLYLLVVATRWLQVSPHLDEVLSWLIVGTGLAGIVGLAWGAPLPGGSYSS